MSDETPGQARWLVRLVDAFDRMSRDVKLGLGLIVAAGPVALIAWWAYGTEPKPGAVTCEGKQMQPGDLCDEYRNGNLVDTKTYDEVWDGIRSGNLWVGRIGFAVAAVLLIVGTVKLVAAVQARRNASAGR